MAVAEQTGLMEKAELKPLLMLSKRQPVSCVIGMTRDKQGVMMLHRLTKPRKLLAEARKKAQEAGMELDRGTMRFGRASIDGATDSGTVHFTVNKEAPKILRMKLIEQLRPVGFQRCEITVDEALETETEADDPTAAGAHDPAEAAPLEAPPASAPPAGGRAAQPPAASAAAANTAAEGAPTPDMPVAGTGRGVGGSSPPPHQGANGPEAQPEAAKPSATGARYQPNSPVFEKARRVWTGIRAKLQTDIDAVVSEAKASLGEGEDFSFVQECFEPIMKSLDDSLSAKLAEIGAAKADHTKLLGEAKAIIDGYKTFVDSDPMVKAIDRNPFHPIALRATLDPVLATLSKTVETSGNTPTAGA